MSTTQHGGFGHDYGPLRCQGVNMHDEITVLDQFFNVALHQVLKTIPDGRLCLHVNAASRCMWVIRFG